MSDQPISPQVMAKFKQYWPRFEKSKNYRELYVYPAVKENAPNLI